VLQATPAQPFQVQPPSMDVESVTDDAI
jgi:hypothetical protein